MFGESESESPRAGSPWDPLIANIHGPKVGGNVEASLPMSYHILKLAPEVEHGNVEYKLKLLNPSQERFTRLVTQLKWRLLEGGGRAYYELGVADSGHLVGLSRADLESSLGTLEMMAEKIGASVVVVKEVEIPGELSTLSGGGKNYIPKLGLTNEDAAVSKNDEESSSRIHKSGVGANGDVSGGLVTVTCRLFFTHEYLEPPESLTNYGIEICTLCRSRSQHSSPVILINQTRVDTDKFETRDSQCVRFTVKFFLGHECEEPPSSPSIESPTPISTSVDGIISKIKTLALNEDRISTPDTFPSIMPSKSEPRFIIEALVVRKLSRAEAFIDFDGFALNG